MDYKHLYMNVLFHMSTQKLIHSTYTPEQCVTIINRLAQEYALGKCSVMYEGRLIESKCSRNVGLYYNSFAPTTNICINKAENGSEIVLLFEMSRAERIFLKFLYLFLIVFEIVFALCEVLSGAIPNVLLLMLPMEMLAPKFRWHKAMLPFYIFAYLTLHCFCRLAVMKRLEAVIKTR